MSTTALDTLHHVAFHDAECGGYAADLPLWRRIAGQREGAVLDLGAGTGRVALALAREGHSVVAVDADSVLLEALAERAAARRLPVATRACEIAALGRAELPGSPFPLAIAPMQLLQMIGGRAERSRALAAIRERLSPGGLLCAALLDDSEPLSSGEAEPLPDVREVDGWIHSSLPLEVAVRGEAVEVVRLRQIVAPGGELSDSRHVERLFVLTPAELEAEASELGYRAAGRERIGETPHHVGSIAVILERTDG